MADSAVDISSLTSDQQLALEQFTAVTHQDHNVAIPLLRKCQWNVQIAIARFFDGEPEDPVAPAIANPPQDFRRQENLMYSLHSSQSSANGALEPAPRIVPQPENQVARQAPFLFSIIFMPFNIVYGLLSKSFGIIGYLFPFLPRMLSRLSFRTNSASQRRNTSGRRPLNPRDTAARFIREFEEEYGTHELPFFENGYAQAFDTAKRDLKFLLVILLSPEHDDTPSFVKDTLLSQEVIELLKNPANNIVVWGGSVQDSEAYQVSRELNCTKLPFAGVIVHTPSVSSTSMSIVARIPGPTPPSQFVAKIQTAISQNSESLDRVRATRAEQQAARNLREAQNTAYERSLAQDRERARQRREAEEQRKREVQAAREKEEAKEREAQNLEQWRRWRAQSVFPEPGPEVKDVVRISLRMQSGDRVVRKFAQDAPIEELYAFVECYDLLHNDAEKSSQAEKPLDYQHEYKFALVSPMPREAYELKDGGTIKERIGRSGNLIVERLEDEDEADDD